MGWPNARIATLNGGTPFPSAVGNALQDAFINYTHIEIEHPLAACAFVPAVGSTAVFDDSLAVVAFPAWKLVDVNSILRAPIVGIPTIDRITSMLMGWYGAGGPASPLAKVHWKIIQNNLGNGATAIIGQGDCVNAAAGGYQTALDAGINAQLNGAETYELRIEPVVGGSFVSPASQIWVTGGTLKHDNL